MGEAEAALAAASASGDKQAIAAAEAALADAQQHVDEPVSASKGWFTGKQFVEGWDEKSFKDGWFCQCSHAAKDHRAAKVDGADGEHLTNSLTFTVIVSLCLGQSLPPSFFTKDDIDENLSSV